MSETNPDDASSDCPHVTTVGNNTWEDILQRKQGRPVCDTCRCPGPNLWLCLHARCLYLGCGESADDHSSSHADGKRHCLTLNLTTLRIWCYVCECEVYKHKNNPPLIMAEKRSSDAPLVQTYRMPSSSSLSLTSVNSSIASRAYTPTTPSPQPSASMFDDSDSDEEGGISKPRGLTGLQNIGNTCYMNAALQTLSNCPPFTRYFLDCSGFVRPEKKPYLSRCFSKLLQEIWHKKRPSYVVPNSVVQGIKYVHPMFRGYSQQDSQEFLRCFMDQIHEELKQAITETSLEERDGLDDETDDRSSDNETDMMIDEEPITVKNSKSCDPTNSQSDTEYETCDSGLSSERSSVENNISSGDEDSSTRNSHPSPSVSFPSTAAERSQAVNRSRRGKRDKNRVNPQSSDDGGGALVGKKAKESANLASQQISKSSTVVGEGREGDIDSGEFSDAVSEMEPLHSDASTGLPHRSKVKSQYASASMSPSRSPHARTRHYSTQSIGKRKKPVEYRSVISDVFDGKILSSVQCLTCERISSTKETFQDLSLPIPSKDHLPLIHASQAAAVNPAGAHKGTCGEVTLNQGGVFSWVFSWMKSWFYGPTITLQDCLAAFFSEDELKGDNMYSCEKCKKLRNGKKYSKVLKLPEILCIHLKRFRHEFMFSTKINSPVSFPLENLDMRPYLHKDCDDQVTSYNLVGVICHHGTAGGGHYTAYGLNYVNESWYEFDDQYVTEVECQQVEHRDAYVLFYRKQNSGMLKLRQRAEQIAECTENTFLKYYISRQWINRFNTFAEPGPIINSDFVCKHGGVHPYKWSYIGDLVQEVPEKLWDFLIEKFGGGPAVNHLYQCTTCQQEIDRLRKRQKSEMDTFLKLQEAFQADEAPDAVYAISLSWFKEWETFVREKRDDPPGPIDNTKICMTKNGFTQVKPKSEYGQISSAMWAFLLDIYAGGPEINLHQSRPPTLASVAQSSSAAKQPEHHADGKGDYAR